jgi:hypothetical protein
MAKKGYMISYVHNGDHYFDEMDTNWDGKGRDYTWIKKFI